MVYWPETVATASATTERPARVDTGCDFMARILAQSWVRVGHTTLRADTIIRASCCRRGRTVAAVAERSGKQPDRLLGHGDVYSPGHSGKLYPEEPLQT